MTKEESLAKPFAVCFRHFPLKSGVDWSVPFCAPTFFPLKLLTLTRLIFLSPFIN